MTKVAHTFMSNYTVSLRSLHALLRRIQYMLCHVYYIEAGFGGQTTVSKKVRSARLSARLGNAVSTEQNASLSI